MSIKNLTQKPVNPTPDDKNYFVSEKAGRTTKRLARHLRHNFKLAVEDRKFLYNLGRRKLVTETQRLAVVCIADQLGVSVKGWLL